MPKGLPSYTSLCYAERPFSKLKVSNPQSALRPVHLQVMLPPNLPNLPNLPAPTSHHPFPAT